METIKDSIIYRHEAEQYKGVQTIHYSRNAIGYVEQGTKVIHQSDHSFPVQAGEIFHLQSGTHYIENNPAKDGSPFRQTLFFYSPADLRSRLTPPESIRKYSALCGDCRNTAGVHTFPSWPLLEDFFRSIHGYIDSQIHITNPELGHLKLCELVHLLLSHPNCCVSHPISQVLSDRRSDFCDTIRNHVFSEASLQEIAALCGMSLSMFKNEFRRHFRTTPHKWYTEKRLAHARFLLITTNRPVAEIAEECLFNNSSHFIKLFKERYKSTPAVYRRTYGGE